MLFEFNYGISGPLYDKMKRDMTEMVDNTTEVSPNFLMYFAHDVTIADHLLALGLFNGKFPPYASAVITELHQLENGSAFVDVSN